MNCILCNKKSDGVICIKWSEKGSYPVRICKECIYKMYEYLQNEKDGVDDEDVIIRR